MLKYLILGTAKCGTTTFASAASSAGLKVFDKKETFLPMLQLGIGIHDKYGLVEDRSQDWIHKELSRCEVVVGTYYILDPRTFDFFRKYCDENTQILLFIRKPSERIISSYNHLKRVNRVENSLDEFLKSEDEYINRSYDPMFYSMTLSNYLRLVDAYSITNRLRIRVIDAENINEFIKTEFKIENKIELNRASYNWALHFRIKKFIRPVLNIVKLVLGSQYGTWKSSYLKFISNNQKLGEAQSTFGIAIDELNENYQKIKDG